VLGLPLHPLIVHLTVVMLPLSALGAIAIAFRPAWSKRFGLIVVAGALVGAVAALISRSSGQELALQVGAPASHVNYGNALPAVAFVFFTVVTIFWLLDRGIPGNRRRPLGLKIFAGVVVLVSVGTIVLTALTGHSGAEAVWGSIGAFAAATQ
jgi:uncharacterized membrane protein